MRMNSDVAILEIKGRRRRKILFALIIVPLLLAVICLIYSYCEARSIVVRNYIYVNKDIPSSFVGKKIVFISDIHCNKYFTQADVGKLVTLINNQKPDLIVIGGDNVCKETPYSSFFFTEIGKLKSKYGVYTVLGNHDHWENAGLIQGGLNKCGFNICDNRSYWIVEGSDSIKIGGVGDLWEDNQLIDKTISDVTPSAFCILLSHNPEYIDILKPEETSCIDLMLSGHTHAGQVTLFGLWAPILPERIEEDIKPQQKRRYGWINEKGIQLYITSGIGMGNTPFRFFASPEIAVITLTNSEVNN